MSARPAGIPKSSDAPFWRGERAETIVGRRVKAYAAEKAAKREARSSRSDVDAGVGRSRQPRTATSQLRRLERALARRKTLEARQRIKQQIAQLRAELES